VDPFVEYRGGRHRHVERAASLLHLVCTQHSHDTANPTPQVLSRYDHHALIGQLLPTRRYGNEGSLVDPFVEHRVGNVPHRSSAFCAPITHMALPTPLHRYCHVTITVLDFGELLPTRRYGNEGSWVDPFVEHRGGGRSAFGVLPSVHMLSMLLNCCLPLHYHCISAGTAMRALGWIPLWSTGVALFHVLCTNHPWHSQAAPQACRITHLSNCQTAACFIAITGQFRRYGNEGSWVDPFVEHRGGGRSAFGVLPWGGCGLTNGDGTVLWPKDQVRDKCCACKPVGCPCCGSARVAASARSAPLVAVSTCLLL
jgi:hypothetical protein